MSLSSQSPEISVVIPALNESAYLRRTVMQLLKTLPARSEIIVVDDGSTDDSITALENELPVRLLHSQGIGAPRARNLGGAQAQGAVLIFIDAHVDTPPGWWQPLVELLQIPRVGATAPAVSVMDHPMNQGFGMRWKNARFEIEWLGRRSRAPYQVPLLPGCCFAMRRDVFQATGGFDEGIVRWGMEDGELSMRLWLLGYELWLAPQVQVAHLFRQKHPYQIDWTTVLHNMLRVAFVHFSPRRIARVVDALKDYRDFATALALCAERGTQARRAELLAQRRYDDDWFCYRFGIAC